MSLTYTLNRPKQAFSRTTAIALIVLIHAIALIAFNNGLSGLMKIIQPSTIKIVELKPEPKIIEKTVVPDVPSELLDKNFKQPIDPPRDVVISITPDIITNPPSVGPVTIEISPTIEKAIPLYSKLSVTDRIDPTYPARAQAAGEQGTVLLEVQIDARGTVLEVNITHSSGFAELDAAAAKAVKHWKFAANTSGARVRVPIKFQLNSQRY